MSVLRLVVAVVALGLIVAAVEVTAFVVLAALTALFVGLAAYEMLLSEDRNAIRGRHLSQSD